MKAAAQICLIALILPAFSACQKGNSPAPQNTAQPTPTAAPNASPALKAAIKITSAAFSDNGMMPPKYTCDGENISPPLKWEGVPEKARTLALIADDPDAPNGTWTHWVLFNLSASARELPENILPEKQPASVASQGTNDFKKIGYGGPCPPGGTHRYFFKLYALDAELKLDAGATKDELLKAMEGHILAEGQLVGKYEKKK